MKLDLQGQEGRRILDADGQEGWGISKIGQISCTLCASSLVIRNRDYDLLNIFLFIWVLWSSCNRNRRQEMLCKKGALRNFAKFTGKHLCQSLQKKEKETLGQMFSCEFCEISKNSFSKNVLTLRRL